MQLAEVFAKIRQLETSTAMQIYGQGVDFAKLHHGISQANKQLKTDYNKELYSWYSKHLAEFAGTTPLPAPNKPVLAQVFEFIGAGVQVAQGVAGAMAGIPGGKIGK